MKKVFNIDDKVWTYELKWESKPSICPVCAGKGWLIIKPKDTLDTQGTLSRCDYCSRNATKIGWVTEYWGYRLMVIQVSIDGIKQQADKLPEYTYGGIFSEGMSSHCILCHDKTYESKTLAREAGEIALIGATQKAEEERVKSRDVIKQSKRESAGWKVGYHKRAIRDAVERVQYHLHQLDMTNANLVIKIAAKL